MQQILFHIPFTGGLFTDMPNGIPVYGFGAMLFLTFVLTAMVWGPFRVRKVGLPKDKLQDLAIVLFLSGIAGARLVYMIQYYERDFPDKSPVGLFLAFFQIWNGGIVFYGSVFGGILGYYLFKKYVLNRFQISTWKLADAIAPLIALGLAIGRIGCYLNGCCWGQVACTDCQIIPLAPSLGEFPLLSAHARDQVIKPAASNERLRFVRGLQTSTGFSITPRDLAGTSDPRSIVLALEPGSAAEKSGLKPRDRIIGVNGQPNDIVVEVSGKADTVLLLKDQVSKWNGRLMNEPDALKDGLLARFLFEKDVDHRQAVTAARDAGLSIYTHDLLYEIVRDWPRGAEELSLDVERFSNPAAPEKLNFRFTPRTVTFYPTQLYETISMILLILLLLAFQPFRRHDGQMIVVMMLGYAAHRFLNEAIRIEPTYALGLTLSQWISIVIALAALGLEVFLRKTQIPLPPGEQPLGYGATPAAT
jgi:prolipoprotein diacylglyceryltransferase